MDRDRKREAWERDLEARQRNIVFPDTAANEARFWRNLTNGKLRTTSATIIYLTIVGLTAVGVIGMLVSQLYELRRAGLPWRQRIVEVAAEWVVGLAFAGGLLLLIKWKASQIGGGRSRKE